MCQSISQPLSQSVSLLLSQSIIIQLWRVTFIFSHTLSFLSLSLFCDWGYKKVIYLEIYSEPIRIKTGKQTNKPNAPLIKIGWPSHFRSFLSYRIEREIDHDRKDFFFTFTISTISFSLIFELLHWKGNWSWQKHFFISQYHSLSLSFSLSISLFILLLFLSLYLSHSKPVKKNLHIVEKLKTLYHSF